jgi:hypothetical protein
VRQLQDPADACEAARAVPPVALVVPMAQALALLLETHIWENWKNQAYSQIGIILIIIVC